MEQLPGGIIEGVCVVCNAGAVDGNPLCRVRHTTIPTAKKGEVVVEENALIHSRHCCYSPVTRSYEYDGKIYCKSIIIDSPESRCVYCVHAAVARNPDLTNALLEKKCPRGIVTTCSERTTASLHCIHNRSSKTNFSTCKSHVHMRCAAENGGANVVRGLGDRDVLLVSCNNGGVSELTPAQREYVIMNSSGRRTVGHIEKKPHGDFFCRPADVRGKMGIENEVQTTTVHARLSNTVTKMYFRSEQDSRRHTGNSVRCVESAIQKLSGASGDLCKATLREMRNLSETPQRSVDVACELALGAARLVAVENTDDAEMKRAACVAVSDVKDFFQRV
jgi:hypothetical protein